MQENYKDFDLAIRSMAQDAEEKAPSGIWEAVSSRLDAIDAAAVPPVSSRAPRRVWAWSGAALAMAAALVAGIFLFRGNGGDASDLIDIVPGKPVAEVAGPASSASVEEPSVEEPSVAPATAAPSASPVPAAAKPSAAASSPVETVSNPGEVVSNPSEPVSTSAETVSNPAEAVSSPAENVPDPSETVTTPSGKVPAADPFALMAFEENKKAGRGRFRISGIVGGAFNSNNASGSIGSYGVGGSSVQHRITEKSNSSYGVPVSFGAGVRFHLNDSWCIGTGVDYSLLTRSFDGVYTDDAGEGTSSEIRHTMHYVGIPLELFYNILNTSDIGIYANIGGEAEYGVANKYHVRALDITESETVNGVQWSAGVGFGVEFRIADVVNLFVEPKAKYYFNCDQPKNVRTEKPLQVVFKAGLRFDL